MARINLIAWDNNRGLSHDIRLLRDALRGLGHEVSFTPATPPRKRRWWQSLALRWSHAWRSEAPYDLNITLEHASPDHLRLARCNAFIPNPEWFSQRDRKQLARYDAVLTKTRAATDIFEGLGVRTLPIGFQSTDCLHSPRVRQPTFLHLAGASRMKGTERLLATWRQHPEWPALHVLQAPGVGSDTDWSAPNIVHRREYVADIAEIRQLQNSHVFHLCLSETEGWGHYIAEALSCGAVVLTCDAAPMNELVTDTRGVLVAATLDGPLNLATRYLFDEAALEAAIERCMRMERAEWEQLGMAARNWYVDNQQGFGARLEAALQQLL